MLQGGAAGVIASQQSVPDTSTALLISCFYDLWEHGDFGLEPAEALRTAQCWLRDSSNREKLERYPELMAGRVPAVTGPALNLWHDAHGHRDPIHWAGMSYFGA
jgi:CHAT domain-containing protein